MKVYIENLGYIEVDYVFQKGDSKLNQSFTFTPCRGIINVAEKICIKITFKTDQLGNFYEEFHLKMKVNKFSS